MAGVAADEAGTSFLPDTPSLPGTPSLPFLRRTKASRTLNLLQIGFNAGHSAATLLTAGGPGSRLISFDLVYPTIRFRRCLG